MSRLVISDLADGTEFRQTLAARPPRIVHGAALLLTSLLVSGVGWSALTKANLVVLAKGRVRTQEIPTRVFTPGGSEFDGRVVEVPVDEGDVVRKGDVLLRLDTTRISNVIARLTRTIEAAAEELANLVGQRELLAMQCHAASEKAQTELRQAEESVRLAAERRTSDIRQAQAELTAAREHYERIRKLIEARAGTQQQLVDARARLHQAEERLVQAELPVDDSAVDVARQAVELVARDFAVREADLETRIAAKQGEIDAGRKDLANLQLQLEAAELRSPIDGVVVSGRFREGDMLEPGKPVFELARQASHCFEAVVPGHDVGHLRVGMPVRIRFDAYDYQKYGALEGRVTFISPDSREIDPALQAEEDRAAGSTPVAFLVRIELLADEVGRGELRGPVKLGLGGTAEIITETESLLNILVKQIRRTISLV